MASSSSAGGGGPSTTAPVIEFRCLFSHDIKRKNQKRWQDARLKYHTYNKRIVVHDERGNYVGDAHWSGAHDEFVEGEELMLERGGVIVQVADAIGQHEQNLGELVDKRAKDVEARRAKAAASATVSRPRPADNVQLSMIQRPISGILGLHGQQQQQSTPSRGGSRLGRAVVPTESPYEARLQRQGEEEGRAELDTPPPSKRRKHSESPPAGKSGHARALFGTQLTLSARPASTPFARTQQQQNLYEPLHDRTNMRVSSLGQKQERQGERDQRRSEQPEQRRMLQQNKHTKPRKRANVSPPPTLEAGSDGDDDDADAQSSDGSVQIVARPLAKQQGSGPRRGRQDIRPAEVTRGGVCKRPTNSIMQTSSSTARRPLKRRVATPPRQKSTSIGKSDEGESEDEDTPHQLASGGFRTAEAATAEAFVVESHASVREKDGRQTGRKKQFTSEKPKAVVTSQLRTAQIGLPRKQDDARAAAEPRTELRIRPRKKRGLLMLSEKLPAAPAADADPVRASTNANTRAAITSETCLTMSKATAVGADPADDAPSNHSFEEWLRMGDADEDQPSSPPSRHSTSEHRPLGKRTGEERRSHGDELLPGRESRKRKDPDSQPHPHHLEKHGETQKGGSTRRSEINIPGSAGKGSDGQRPISRGGESSSQEGTEQKQQQEGDGQEDSDGLLSRSNVQRTSSSDAGQTSAQAAPHTNIQSRVPVFSDDQPMRTETDASDRESSHAQGTQKKQAQIGPGQGGAGKDQGHQASSAASAPTVSSSSSSLSSRNTSNTKGRGKGPRIARMGRRSVKSKEVFGLQVPDDRYLVPNELATASAQIESPKLVEQQDGQNQSRAATLERIVRPIAQKNIPAHDHAKVLDAVSIQASAKPTTNTLAQPQAKPDRGQGTNEPTRWMTNPATRGKKAATRADAAGLAPQSLVPFDAVPPNRPLQQLQQRTMPKTASKPIVATATVAVSTNNTTSLPSFRTANGGAWSKHAEDLLGMTRPK